MLRAPRPYCEASKATNTISLKLGVVDNEKLLLLAVGKKLFATVSYQAMTLGG